VLSEKNCSRKEARRAYLRGRFGKKKDIYEERQSEKETEVPSGKELASEKKKINAREEKGSCCWRRFHLKKKK